MTREDPCFEHRKRTSLSIGPMTPVTCPGNRSLPPQQNCTSDSLSLGLGTSFCCRPRSAERENSQSKHSRTSTMSIWSWPIKRKTRGESRQWEPSTFEVTPNVICSHTDVGDDFHFSARMFLCSHTDYCTPQIKVSSEAPGFFAGASRQF